MALRLDAAGWSGCCWLWAAAALQVVARNTPPLRLRPRVHHPRCAGLKRPQGGAADLCSCSMVEGRVREAPEGGVAGGAREVSGRKGGGGGGACDKAHNPHAHQTRETDGGERASGRGRGRRRKGGFMQQARGEGAAKRGASVRGSV